jgi:serine phosphatase RsbU (regulator of sigma subunit)
MSEDAVPKGWDDAQEVQDLRQFFYQCPVGLLEIDDNGRVHKVNPAAVAILAPALGRDNLAELFPVLDRLAPQMSKLISGDRDRMGPLAAGERILVPAEVHGTSSLEIRAVRVAAERVMVVLLDVSAERRLAAERDRLLAAEKAAHAEATAARDRAEEVSRQERAARLRLQALQEVTVGLATAVTSEQIAGVLTRQGMSLVADHGVVSLLAPDGSHLLTQATSDFPVSVAQAYARVPIVRAGETPVGQAALHGKLIMMASAEEIAAHWPLVAPSRALTGTSSLLAVPVRAAGRTIGALGFGFRAAGPVSAEIVRVAETLAELTGQALSRARLYEDEHAVAHQLQQALLPKVPAELPGAGIGVCYRPADHRRDVGGDWYDVFELPAGRIGFGVGDVVGHDLVAAVAMGRLQQLLRYVATGGARPAEVLQALDEACPAVTGTEYATLGYAEYDPAESVITYACAGHPPPLLVADGHAIYLNEGRSAPLGFKDGPRPEAQLAAPYGAMLIWYSDGLIERRGEAADLSLGQLAALAAALTGTNAQHWCESLLAGMTDGQFVSDDVAVACLHLRGLARSVPDETVTNGASERLTATA